MPEDGLVVTLESNPHHADVARANIAEAGLALKTEVSIGPAERTLRGMIEHGARKFDLVFIDADKPSNPVYLSLVKQLIKPGAIVIGDNIVRDGAVIDASSEDDRVQGVREFTRSMGEDDDFQATALQTVGVKGWDGFTLAIFSPRASNREA